jgi:hypothetical protein
VTVIIGSLIKPDGFLRWPRAGRKRRKPKGLMSGAFAAVATSGLRIGAQEYIANAVSCET